MAGPKEMRQVQ